MSFPCPCIQNTAAAAFTVLGALSGLERAIAKENPRVLPNTPPSIAQMYESPADKTSFSDNQMQTQGVYNFSGTINDVISETPITNAELIFRSPDGNVYDNVFTDASGNYTTSIDTYVDIDERAIFKNLGVSKTWPNPTGDRAGIYINVPKTSDITVSVFDILGRDVSDKVLVDRLNETVSEGQYYQEMDFSKDDENDSASGVYLIRVTDGNNQVVTKTEYVKGAANTTPMGGSAPTESDKWVFANSLEKTASETWTLTIKKDGYQDRETPVYANQGDNSLDESMLSESFDLAFFDECTGRTNGTVRWRDSPKLYIIDGPVEGYTGFETPSETEVQQVINTWKDKIYNLSDGKIVVTDDMIYRGHDPNDADFQDAVKQIADGNVLQNKGYDAILWTNTIPGSGAHSEKVENGVIVSAKQRYRPGTSRGNIEVEAAQSIGFPVDPTNIGDRHNGNDFTQKFYDCGKYLYSRTPLTLSPDKSVQ